MSTGGPSPGAKARPGRDAYYSPPSSAVVAFYGRKVTSNVLYTESDELTSRSYTLFILRFILILISHRCSGLGCDLFPSGLSTKTLYSLLSSHASCMPCPSYLILDLNTVITYYSANCTLNTHRVNVQRLWIVCYAVPHNLLNSHVLIFQALGMERALTD
jgi:hypothetical protein